MLETFKVNLFDTERKIRVYLPHGYDKTSKRYPVLYMHDGQNVFGSEEAIGGVSLELHEYLDKNEIDLIVVAIDLNTEGEERLNEYCPWTNGEFSEQLLGYKSTTGGKGNDYMEFIVNHLKPEIDHNYRTSATDSYMAGISLGGLISIYAACRYPTVFRRVAGISTAFFRNQEEIENLLKDTELSMIQRIYLDCGTSESGENTRVSELFLASNQAVYEILKDKVSKSKVQFHLIAGGEHNYKTFKKRLPEVITFLTT
jgi:predicted alpha/beta superfamily hydrolase